MSSNNGNLSSQTIKYKKVKGTLEEKDDAEILITTEIESGHNCSKVGNEKTYFKLCLIVSAIFSCILILLMISTATYLFTNTNESPKQQSYIMATPSQTKLHEGFNSTCFTLDSVDEVIICLSEARNYSCSDNATCNLLLQNIEQKQNGLNYNFVVGSDSELYLGMGFKCRVNHSQNALYIKVLRNDILSENSNLEFLRISEILEQGVKCGKISEHFSVSTICEDESVACLHPFELLKHHFLLKTASRSNERQMLHSPQHEMGTILHRDLKWIACGKTPEDQKELVKSKVITVQSLTKRNCLPYQPVDHISVDIVETSAVKCSNDSSCDNMVHAIEKDHDGLRYNFIIGTHLDLYVGLGFRCSADITNTLKIKILRLNQYFAIQEVVRVAEIIEQGRNCGKIVSNYSISTRCEVDNNNITGNELDIHCYSLVNLLEKGSHLNLVDHYANNGRLKQYSDELNDSEKIVRQHLKWMACHKDKHSLDVHVWNATKLLNISTEEDYDWGYSDDSYALDYSYNY